MRIKKIGWSCCGLIERERFVLVGHVQPRVLREELDPLGTKRRQGRRARHGHLDGLHVLSLLAGKDVAAIRRRVVREAPGSGGVNHAERIRRLSLRRDRKRDRDSGVRVSIESGEEVGVSDARTVRVVGHVQPTSRESDAKQSNGKHRFKLLAPEP